MKVAVLGSGNGAHAVAFEFAKAGHDIYMCDFEMFPVNIAAIAEQGGIHAEGELEGFQKVTYAGHDFETAVKDADVVMVVATGEGTVPFAKACKPYVKEGQMFFICPGSCFGSVEFKRTLGYDHDLADDCSRNSHPAIRSKNFRTRQNQSGKPSEGRLLCCWPAQLYNKEGV